MAVGARLPEQTGNLLSPGNQGARRGRLGKRAPEQRLKAHSLPSTVAGAATVLRRGACWGCYSSPGSTRR